MSTNLQIDKMKELELESEDSPTESDNETEIDTSNLSKALLLCEKQVTSKKKYVLQVTATLNQTPNVALGISDHTCSVFQLNDTELSDLATFSEHRDVVSDIKFDQNNNNLLYTCSNDGSIRLWDLRTPNKASLEFRDNTVDSKKDLKPLSSFDISANGRLLAAGTNLVGGDAFILFWDVRKRNLMGGYWESHSDDLTQVRFHPTDSNKLMTGSLDCLINIFDLKETTEDDALIDSLNTGFSIEKLKWLEINNNDVISCIAYNTEIQFWRSEDSQAYLHLHPQQIQDGIQQKKTCYLTDVIQIRNKPVLLAGINEGCLRGLTVEKNTVEPLLDFPENKQTVRSTWFNPNTNLLLTGGENGVLNAWNLPNLFS